MKCGIFDCRPAQHVACALCGRAVCLGGLSEFQRERVLSRARIDGKPVAHAECAQTQRRAA